MDFTSSPQYAQLWLPVPLRRTFTYRVPAIWPRTLRVGDWVWAPLGRRKVLGLVMELYTTPPTQGFEIKEILSPLAEESALAEPLLALLRWAQAHYLAPEGEILRSLFPGGLFKGKISGDRAKTWVSKSILGRAPEVILSSEQAEAVASIRNALGTFFPVLLQGVTGSGKTEVYLRLCEEVLGRGGGALILVPEIALTPQTVGRFQQRFPDQVGSYHSGMTEAQRLKAWSEAKSGRRKIFVGTRSAIALPLENLALIVVDEEHDPSYKQEERFRYHARDMGVVRAALEKIPIVLGSATPSVESLENARTQKYQRLLLRDRATQAPMPQVQLIDLKQFPPHSETLLTQPLRERVHQVLEKGQQALFFLNRRGWAPTLLCQDCGTTVLCPHCDIALTFYRQANHLRCHYCEYQGPRPELCAGCGGFNLLLLGAGTERLEAGFRKEFPGARVGRLDREVVGSRQATEEVLAQFASGNLDILIGTQLVTKGHDFERLTLVGVLLADVALNLPDFRAAERAFQLVTQVAGRAGRHALGGEVLVQTYRPEHYAIQAALHHDPEAFFLEERRQRETLGYPPFARVVLFRISGLDGNKVARTAHDFALNLRQLLKNFSDVLVLGPAPATLERLRAKYRWQVMVRTKVYEGVRRVLAEQLSRLEASFPSGVQLYVDVDPAGFS